MGMAGAICCQAHAGMHLREHAVIAEIVDEAGRPLPRGEWGELVITTIGLEAMPLIRYRTGDTTRILPGPCPCGSQVLRLDTVRRKEGSEMAALDEALFSLPFVADYRAERWDGRLILTVLTCGEGELPDLDAEIRRRPVRLEDRPLYAGKRKVVCL
jgi:hypothetical protein